MTDAEFFRDWLKLKSTAIAVVLALWITCVVTQPLVAEITRPKYGFSVLAFGKPNKLVPDLYNGFHLKFFVINKNYYRKNYVLTLVEKSTKSEVLKSQVLTFDLSPGKQKTFTRVIWKWPPGTLTITMKDPDLQIAARIRGNK